MGNGNNDWLHQFILQNPEPAATTGFQLSNIPEAPAHPSTERDYIAQQKQLAQVLTAKQQQQKTLAFQKQQLAQRQAKEDAEVNATLDKQIADLYGDGLDEQQHNAARQALRTQYQKQYDQQKQQQINAIPNARFSQLAGVPELKAKTNYYKSKVTGGSRMPNTKGDLFHGDIDTEDLFDDKGNPTPQFKKQVYDYAGGDQSKFREVADAIVSGRIKQYEQAPSAFADFMQTMNQKMHDSGVLGKAGSYLLQTAGSTAKGLATIGAAGANILEAPFVTDSEFKKPFGERLNEKTNVISKALGSVTPENEQGLDKLFGELSRATGEYILAGQAEIRGLGALGSSTLFGTGTKRLGKALTTGAERSAFLEPTGRMVIPELANSSMNKLAAQAYNGLQNLSGSRAVQFLDNTVGFFKGAGPQVYSGYYDQLRQQGYAPEEASSKAWERTFINAIVMGGPRNFISQAEGKVAAKEIFGATESNALKNTKSVLSKVLGEDNGANKVLSKVFGPTENNLLRYTRGAATNAAYGAVEGGGAGMADAWQNFEDAKEHGELPQDAKFPWAQALEDAKHGASVNALLGGIMGTVNQHGVAPRDPQARAISMAISDPHAFRQQLYRAAAKGEIAPEQVQTTEAFINKVQPHYEQALQMKVPSKIAGMKVGEKNMSPDLAAKHAVESARLDETIQRLQQLSEVPVQSYTVRDASGKTITKNVALDEHGLYTEDAYNKLQQQKDDLQAKAKASEKTMTQLAGGTYVKDRTISGPEMKSIVADNTPGNLKQAKDIGDNGPYRAETVDASQFATDPDVQRYAAIMRNPEDVKAYADEVEKLRAERDEINAKYTGRKDEATGLEIKKATDPGEEDAARINEINKAITELNERYPLFKDADKVASFQPQGEVPPVLDNKGGIIDGRKRIAHAIANGESSIEVVRPLSNKETDSQVKDALDEVVGSDQPNYQGLDETRRDHLTAAAEAYNEHADDPAKAFTAAADVLIQRGVRKRTAVEILRRLTNDNISIPQAEQYYNSVKNGTREVPDVKPVVTEDKTGAQMLDEIIGENPLDINAGVTNNDFVDNDTRGVAQNKYAGFLKEVNYLSKNNSADDALPRATKLAKDMLSDPELMRQFPREATGHINDMLSYIANGRGEIISPLEYLSNKTNTNAIQERQPTEVGSHADGDEGSGRPAESEGVGPGEQGAEPAEPAEPGSEATAGEEEKIIPDHLSKQIVRSVDGNIEKVLAPNGDDSMLYESILKHIGGTKEERYHDTRYYKEFNSDPEFKKIGNYGTYSKYVKTNDIVRGSAEDINAFRHFVDNFYPPEVRERAATLWAQVYKYPFKKWFGDWEKDPSNSSKILDENGEPQVVYHNSKAQFESFDKGKKGTNTRKADTDAGFFFTEHPEFAKFDTDIETFGNIKYATFLNIRNPVVDMSYAGFDTIRRISRLRDFIEKAEQSNYDGMIMSKNMVHDISTYSPEIKTNKEQKTFFKQLERNFKDPTHIEREQDLFKKSLQQRHRPDKSEYEYIVAFEPNQIKHIENSGRFDPASDNMYDRTETTGPSRVYFEQAGMERSGTIISEDNGQVKIKGENGRTYTVPKGDVRTEPTPEFKEPETKDEKQSFADKLISYGEKLKKNKGTYGTFIPITPELMGRSLVVIGKTFKATENLARAIKAGIKYVRANIEGKFDEKAYEAEVRRHFKEADRKPIKTEIKEEVQSRDKKPVTIDEYDLLKNQLRMEAKAAAGGFKEGKRLQQSFTQRVAPVLKEALTAGYLTDRQIQTLIGKSNAIGTSEAKLSDFMDYVDKVMVRSADRSLIQQGYGLRDKIRTANNLKSIEHSAANKELVKQFLKIDPNRVDDIDEYNEIAGKVLATTKMAAVKNGEVSNATYDIDNAAIEDYVNYQAERAEQISKDRLADIYDDLVGTGQLDPKNMSLAEMRQVLDEIHKDTDSGALDAVDKDAQKKAALREVVEYQKSALSDYAESGTQQFTETQREVTDQLRDIDTEQLDAKQLVKLNDVINNIITNHDFHDAGNIAAIATVQRRIPELREKEAASGIEFKNNKFARKLAEGFASNALMTEFIAKNTKLAAEVQRLSGIHGIFSGHAVAKKLQDRTISDYTKLKKSLPDDIDNAANRYQRGVYARAIQDFGGTPAERQAEYERAKRHIRQTADRLMSSGIEREQQEGRAVDQAYNELLDKAATPEDIKISAANKKLVDFWQKEFADRSEKTAENAAIYNNILWEDINNYTSTKMKTYNGEAPKSDKDIFEQQYFSKKVDNTPAGTKQRRTKLKDLPKNSVLDLDFDRVMSQRYYETNYDVEANKAIAEVRAFFDSPASAELLGGVENRKMVLDSIKKSVQAQRGKNPQVEPWEKMVTRIANTVQQKSVRIALGSLSQAIKQYPSVALNTLINLGPDIGLYAKAVQVGKNIELFDKFNIGLRGETKAGYNKDVDLGEIDRAALGNDIKLSLNKLSSVGEKVANAALKTLEVSDVAVARHSWLAYYMQDLARQGIDLNTVNWKQEHLKPNEEAAAYAEQQVSRTQNPNDPSSMANIYKNAKGAGSVLRNIIMPFSSFSLNQRVRMSNDVQKWLYGNKQSKSEAIRSLAATAAEQALFNALKVYVLGLATTAGAHGISSLFGMWDDEDQDKYETGLSGKLGRKFWGNAISDFFFSGMGGMTQAGLNKVTNKAYQATTGDEKPLFYSYDPAKYGDPDYSLLGLYGVAPQQISSLYKSGSKAITGQTDYYTKGGFESKAEKERVDITPEERALYTLTFLVDAAAMLGLSDAEVSVMNKKIEAIANQKMEKKYGGPITVYHKGKKQ